MGIPLEEYAEASFGIVTIHAPPMKTFAAIETMLRRDMTSFPRRLEPHPEFRLQMHSGKNFPMPLLVPFAKLQRTGWRGLYFSSTAVLTALAARGIVFVPKGVTYVVNAVTVAPSKRDRPIND
jgi:hypothetical protein